MKFKVGDQVKLLNEAYGGTITICIPPDSYQIKTTEGFPEIHEEDNLVHYSDPNIYIQGGDPPDKEGIGKPAKKDNLLKNKQKVVDLHSYNMPDGKTSLPGNPEFRKQLDKFRLEMDYALENNLKEIIFIHGKGEGVLRIEIRMLLDEYYPEATYMDASFRDFGMKGATRVCIP